MSRTQSDQTFRDQPTARVLGAAPIDVRPVRDEDALDLIELIGSCFGEYENCVLDVDGEMPQLRRLASYAVEKDGAFWVAELAGAGAHPAKVVGMGGFLPRADPSARVIEVHKLYVHRMARAFGLGGRLLSLVEEAARGRGANVLDLWSDTRFTTAHAFYEKRGFSRGPTTRDLHDKSNSVEFYFRKELGQVPGQGA